MAEAKPKNVKPEMVTLALNEASGVDVLGDGKPPLLWVGIERDFTVAESKALLALKTRHGVSVVRTVDEGA